jgi:hypothetical protein
MWWGQILLLYLLNNLFMLQQDARLISSIAHIWVRLVFVVGLKNVEYGASMQAHKSGQEVMRHTV